MVIVFTDGCAFASVLLHETDWLAGDYIEYVTSCRLWICYSRISVEYERLLNWYSVVLRTTNIVAEHIDVKHTLSIFLK
jgi:hypothetical protein